MIPRVNDDFILISVNCSLFRCRCRSFVVAEIPSSSMEIPSSSMKIPSKSMKIPSKSMKIPSKSIHHLSKIRRNRCRRQPKSFVAESQFVFFSPKSSSPLSPPSFSSSNCNVFLEFFFVVTKLPPSLPLSQSPSSSLSPPLPSRNDENIITSLHVPLSLICLDYHIIYMFSQHVSNIFSLSIDFFDCF